MRIIFYLADFLKTSSPRGSLSDGSTGLLQDKREEPGHIGVLQQRVLLLIKENQVSQINFALFYVWEDARVGAHWNHSIDKHLSCLGPVSSPILSPLRVHGWGVAAGAEGLAAGHPFVSILSFLRAHCRGGCSGLMAAISFVYWNGRQRFSFTYWWS